MDGDLAEKLRGILSDPDAMARISSLAGGLSGTGQSAPDPPAQSGAPVFAPQTERDPRVALLYSLKPLLREEKREKIDSLARALAVVSMVRTVRK